MRLIDGPITLFQSLCSNHVWLVPSLYAFPVSAHRATVLIDHYGRLLKASTA